MPEKPPKNLKTLRKEKGYKTLEAFSEEFNKKTGECLSPPTLCNYETGKRGISKKRFSLFVEFLDLTFEEELDLGKFFKNR